MSVSHQLLWICLHLSIMAEKSFFRRSLVQALDCCSTLVSKALHFLLTSRLTLLLIPLSHSLATGIIEQKQVSEETMMAMLHEFVSDF